MIKKLSMIYLGNYLMLDGLLSLELDSVPKQMVELVVSVNVTATILGYLGEEGKRINSD